jgi:hypothetical protein
MNETDRQFLIGIRRALLRLHKTLLDWERVAYERLNGRTSPSEMLKAITTDPQFAWLRPLSELIIRIDVALDADREGQGVESLDANEMAAQMRLLLIPDENGTSYQRRYYAALQDHPDAVLAHREVTTLLDRTQKRPTLH